MTKGQKWLEVNDAFFNSSALLHQCKPEVLMVVIITFIISNILKHDFKFWICFQVKPTQANSVKSRMAIYQILCIWSHKELYATFYSYMY